jgi:GntR family transcriptional regulator, transcriptional repressor for pyruvate dehydrogenase complex
MADQVETQLRDYIIKRSIRPGDSIHKEMEMAEALGVSSNVVRETLSWLRMAISRRNSSMPCGRI